MFRDLFSVVLNIVTFALAGMCWLGFGFLILIVTWGMQ